MCRRVQQHLQYVPSRHCHPDVKKIVLLVRRSTEYVDTTLLCTDSFESLTRFFGTDSSSVHILVTDHRAFLELPFRTLLSKRLSKCCLLSLRSSGTVAATLNPSSYHNQHTPCPYVTALSSNPVEYNRTVTIIISILFSFNNMSRRTGRLTSAKVSMHCLVDSEASDPSMFKHAPHKHHCMFRLRD